MASSLPAGSPWLSNVECLKVAELKELCTALALPVTGVRTVIVERLAKAFAAHKEAEGNLDEEA